MFITSITIDNIWAITYHLLKYLLLPFSKPQKQHWLALELVKIPNYTHVVGKSYEFVHFHESP